MQENPSRRSCKGAICACVGIRSRWSWSRAHFAALLRRYWRGILARVRLAKQTGESESVATRIKVIKRMAYGYRDTDFFFMKIRATFPGNP